MMNRFIKEVWRCVRHFLVLIIFVLIFLGFFFLRYVKCKGKAEHNQDYMYASTNTERVYGDRRVFDYADRLTDEQEAELEKYIHEAELMTVSDIAIITLNESLASYAEEYRPSDMDRVPPEKYVMVYGDEFWEQNRFGYDSPQVPDGTTTTGDGVLLVDNVFREPETDKVYTWMCTTGICEEKFSEYMTDSCLGAFYDKVDTDYYQACIDYVDKFTELMKPYYYHSPSFFHFVPLGIAVIILLAYFFTKREYESPGTAVTFSTYLVGDPTVDMIKEDNLLSSDVQKRVHISSGGGSSGSHYSGGGGHHVSRSGGSHGGSGRSR